MTISEFQQLLDESLQNVSMVPGTLVKGEVLDVTKDYVVVGAGLKSESIIPVEQFYNDRRELEVKVGDEVEVILDAVENGFGETRLSREKAKRAEAWVELEKAHTSNETIIGFISGRVKGGFTVEVKNIRAFLPGSLVDVRPTRDLSYLEGKDIEVKVIKIDAKRNNVVVSRRSVIEEESHADRDSLLNTIEEGQRIKGVIKNLTDYGAFVDLGGIDGLLHITDMAWKRVRHPSEVVNIGDELDVMVLKFDKEKSRVSLGLKQLDEDPWQKLISNFPIGSRISGKVTNIADYGCFVEIEDGIEGLVHVSEMDWTNKNIHPSKVVSLGDMVDVMVLDIDADRRRISLGIKQCQNNPWQAFAETHQKGEKVKGNIKSITDFGVFIGLDGAIDGLIHLSDISWEEDGEQMVRELKKGDEVEALILAIDPERERISLGIKQLIDDPFGQFVATHGKGAAVEGVVVEVTAGAAMIEVADTVIAKLPASEISREKVTDVNDHFKVGDKVTAKMLSSDRKTRDLILSLKAKEADDEAKALKQYSDKNTDDSAGKATLGDLFSMNKDDE